MRKLGLTLVIAFAVGLTVSFAQQMEIKVNPLALATSDFKASFEYLQSEFLILDYFQKSLLRQPK